MRATSAIGELSAYKASIKRRKTREKETGKKKNETDSFFYFRLFRRKFENDKQEISLK